MKKLVKMMQKMKQNRFELLIFLCIFAAFFVNTFHTQFPDEFDNIYGGFLIDHGTLPYIGFFTHHNPGAYFLASIITFITGRSFVLFRIAYSILLFVMLVGSYALLKKQLKPMKLHFYLLYGVLIALGATYWWGQMLLSETIVGYLLVPVFMLIIIKRLYNIQFETRDLWIVSIGTFLSLFVSLTYIYLVPFIDLAVIYFYFSGKPVKKKNVLNTFIIFSAPVALFLAYLGITGSAKEFYFSSIYYNVNYYIYNFPNVAGTFSHNPVRYAISIAKHTIESYTTLLAQVGTFNLMFPFTISLALGNIALIIYFALRRQFALVLLVVSMIFYTNARSEPLNIKETDFHATVFIMITIALSAFFLFEVKEYLNKKLPESEKIILSFIYVLTAFYWFFSSIYLTNKFLDKSYNKYMGNEPLIYDRPQTANTLNKIITENDYFWIGPFELQELLFIRGKVASKYFWFLPANSRDSKIKNEIKADLLRTQPKVIIFKKWYSNFGVKPEDFNGTIVEILDRDYFQIRDLRNQGLNLQVNVRKERDFNFEDEYFFLKSRKDEITKELIEKGLISII